MKYGFLRVACVSPELKVADCRFNSEKIIESVINLSREKVSIIVFPELCITGYTCGDLFFQKALTDSALTELKIIAEKTKDIKSLFFVGLPLCLEEGIFNCAVAISGGKILAFIPKTFLPNYGEFYERRQFTPFSRNMKTKFINLDDDLMNIPFGTDILISDKKNPLIKIGVEICEDLWVPISPSVRHCLNGASIIANLSSGNEIIGKASYRRMLIKSHSAKNICAYLYANSGHDESSQDMIFASHNLICENGSLLKESKLFSNETIITDIDTEKLLQERRKTTSFSYSVDNIEHNSEYLVVSSDFIIANDEKLLRFVDSHPFVPSYKQERFDRCEEVISLQAEGLAKRIRHINLKSAVIGLSGGLDSTLALLVTERAFDLCKIDRKQIFAITMPCFGTTGRTYNNACILAKESGATLKEIQISKSVIQHLSDIGHSIDNHDVTYENAQARERTQVLMDYANKVNGIVIGTGDLSELALGWCTYNGDHMSMYGVNNSVPKTLVRYLVEWFSDEVSNIKIKDVLIDILNTPVSPELLPPTDGKIAQVTEDIVGPYELHDFFLYYLLRYGYSPKKILYLAENASFSYDRQTILKWLRIFYKRFFSQQFKRSCMPDGVKIGTVNLSPRGDWRMPSDASANIWLAELDEIQC